MKGNYFAIAHGTSKAIVARCRSMGECATLWTPGTYWGRGESYEEASAAAVAVALEPWGRRGLRFKGEILMEDAA